MENQDVKNVWPVVEKIRMNYLGKYQCDYFRAYIQNPANLLDNIEELEKRLNVSQNNKINDKIPPKKIDDAVKIFVYFFFCPPSVENVFELFEDILKNYPKKDLILTLTRYYRVSLRW